MQIVNQIQETILPILLRRPSPRRVMNKICKKIHEKSQKIRCCHKEVECLSAIQDDFSIKIAKFSLLCDPYEVFYYSCFYVHIVSVIVASICDQ